MAQRNTTEQIRTTDFAQVRPWQTYARATRAVHNPDQYRQPRFRTDINSGSRLLDLFEQTIYQRNSNTGEPRPEFCLARLVSEAFAHVQYLKCMVDDRHQVQHDPPSTDGVNIHNFQHLQMFWNLQETLRCFHSKGLYILYRPITLIDGDNFEDHIHRTEFSNFLDHLKTVDRLERVQKRRLRRGLGTILDAFRWIGEFERSIQDAYDAVVAAWTWSLHGENRSLNAVMGQVLRDIPEMTRLLMLLLEREKSFDSYLSREHLFGCLYDKRIELLGGEDLSEIWDTRGCWIQDPDHADDPMYEFLYIHQHLEGLYSELAVYQERLKDLFDYKYLMEWHWHTLWDQLYVVINPDMRISDRTIDKFNNWADNNGLVARKIFGVRPIKRSEVQDEVCAICLDNYLESKHLIGVLVLKTKCGHWFHPKCLIDGWDQPEYWRNICPYCRQPAGRLRDVIDFDAEQQDLEMEEPDDANLLNLYYNTVKDEYDNKRRLSEFDHKVKEVFWRRMVRESVLDPQRARREANGPIWASILGGGI